MLENKKKHRVSASGVATGVNTPPAPLNPSDSTIRVGPTEMSMNDFNEAKRYFELFQAALKHKYPEGGYTINLHETTAQCVVKGRKTCDVFKFAFQPMTIKNHYIAFRLVDHFENYLNHIRSQPGVDYSNVYTPDATGQYLFHFKS